MTTRIDSKRNNLGGLLLVLLLCLCAVPAFGQKTRLYKFFTSTGNACPIKVVVNGKAYALNSGSSTFSLSLAGTPSISAYDKYGDKMRISTEAVMDGSRTHITHISVNVGANHWVHYPKQSRSNDNSSSSSSSSSSSRSSSSSSSSYSSSGSGSGSSIGSEIGHAVARAITQGTGNYSSHYPNFQIGAGLSRAYGEFARLRWYTGGDSGLVLFGGAGKDWLLDGNNKNVTSWHVGIGGYDVIGRDDNQDMSFALVVAETPVCEGKALLLDYQYSYYLGRSTRVGAFVGGGLGVGNLDSIEEKPGGHGYDWSHAKFMWDVTVGVVVKLFQ